MTTFRPATLVELRGAPTLKPHLQKRGGRWFVNGPDPTGAALLWAVARG